MRTAKRGAVIIAVIALLLGIGVALPSLAQPGGGRSDDHRRVLDLRGDVHDEDEEDDEDDEYEDDEYEDDEYEDDEYDEDDEDDERDHDRDGPGELISNLSWSGTLCSGDDVVVAFSLYENAVMLDSVRGPTSRVRSTERGVQIRFDEQGARVGIRSDGRGGSDVRLDANLGSCDSAEPPAPPTTAPPTTAPPTTAPPTTSSSTTETTAPPTTPPTEPPTTTTQPPTTLAKQKRYLTYQISGQGEMVIEFDEPRNMVQFWAFTPSNGTCWYTYKGKEPGTRVETGFSDQTKFLANVGSSGVSASYDGATISPSGNSTVAPASTRSSC